MHVMVLNGDMNATEFAAFRARTAALWADLVEAIDGDEA